MDSLDTSLVCIIGACAMLCNIIILLGKTDMHEDQRLATGGCFLLSLCLTVLGIFLQGTFPYFAYAGTVFMLYTLINMIVGEKIPFFVSGVFFYCIHAISRIYSEVSFIVIFERASWKLL